MGIKFASGGFLTTVQDMGRTGYQESGMSVSGVMDQRSAAIANILVGNDENEAVLEVTLMGPMMEFTEDNIIAVTGGNLVPKVNGKDLPMYQAVLVHKGDSMNFAGMTSGSRAYIAVAGGTGHPGTDGQQIHQLKAESGRLSGKKDRRRRRDWFCRSEDDPSKYEKEKSDAGGLLPDRENHPRCHGTAG